MVPAHFLSLWPQIGPLLLTLAIAAVWAIYLVWLARRL
jgi:hypothetical protein